MSLTKETIKFNNVDMNLKFTLSSSNEFSGYQEEIDSLTQFTATDLVNPVTDAEVRKFKYFTSVPSVISFLFNNGSGVYTASLTSNGFTGSELVMRTANVRNSFFILDYYDSFDIYDQNKIFTTFLTKITTTSTTIPTYSLNSIANNQFYSWYVPVSYIEATTGTTAVGYVKFRFYNAKTGKIVLFYNFDNLSLSSPEKMFFKTELNIPNMTWRFVTASYPNMKAREIESTNTLFINKTNDNFNTFENLAQDYPSGNSFNFASGTYLTI